jgi:hypothetical protein
MLDWFRRKSSPKPEKGQRGSEMFYRFLCFPDGSGHVELYSDLIHPLGYAGSFSNQKDMFEIITHLVIVMPPSTTYDTIIKFVYRHNAG